MNIFGYNPVLDDEVGVLVSYGSLKTIDIPHFHTHNGEAFSHAGKHTLPASGTPVDFLIVPDSGTQIHLINYHGETTVGPVDMFLYEAPFTDANSLGTDISASCYNHKRTSTNSCGATMYLNPFTDANSMGSQIDYSLQPSSTGGPLTPGAGTVSGHLNEWMLDSTKSYLLRYHSGATTAGALGMAFDAYKNTMSG